MRVGFLTGRKAIGLGLMVSVAWPGSGLHANERWRDWSRVQALRPGQKIVVRSFKGMDRTDPKVVGTYLSSDATHLVVRRQDGQAVTLPRDQIRRVVRRLRARHAIKIGAAAGFAVLAGWAIPAKDIAHPVAFALVFGAIGAGIGALIGLAVRAVPATVIVYQVENQGRRVQDAASPEEP